MNIKQTKMWKFLSSIKLVIWVLSFIALFSLIGTLIPQNKEPAEYISRYGQPIYRIFSITGLTDIYSAWWFVLSLVLLFLNLVICLFNRLSLKIHSLGTLIAHISILVILAGAFMGMLFGEKGYVRIREGEMINSFLTDTAREHTQCSSVTLDFSVRLDDFIYEEHIDPEEKILVYSNEGELASEVPVEVGKESKIGETGYKIKILRYVADFVMDTATKQVSSRSFEPRNPAVEVEFRGKDGLKTFWVFAAYPDTHKKAVEDFKFKYHWAGRRAKDFISKVTVIKDGKEVLKKTVRVNAPLKFGGYTFFQFNYDNEHLNWTGLQVVKDPGVPIVYLGFILLILGLCVRFYIKPLIKGQGGK